MTEPSDSKEEKPDVGRSIAGRFQAQIGERLVSRMTSNLFTDSTLREAQEAAQRRSQGMQELLDSFEVDDSPRRTAENTAALAKLTQANLDQARNAQRDALNAEHRSNRISWVSLIISGAALLTAIATLLRTNA